jgi:RNA polymerase sigma-70 factor, ECF subfamily
MKRLEFLANDESFRKFYGQLFASLLGHFGPYYSNEIEDAIQNAFYKSLKSWKPDKFPTNKVSWLYCVAKNDVLSQIKRSKQNFIFKDIEEEFEIKDDQRLHIILAITAVKSIKPRHLLFFVLKNIFGLSTLEISIFTLQSEEAIYKVLARTKNLLSKELKSSYYNEKLIEISQDQVNLVEEIFYMVFNMAFDSFDSKVKSTINDDLCLDALALVQLLYAKCHRVSSKNLSSLFCFHLARIPAKIHQGKFITFFNQDKKLWDQSLIQLGIQNLTKPVEFDKFYIEALIVSKHMITESYDQDHWQSIIDMYKLLQIKVNSPFVSLNLVYCLHRAGKVNESLEMLANLENRLPAYHLYYSMVKLHVDQELSFQEKEYLIEKIFNKVDHEVRMNLIKSYI